MWDNNYSAGKHDAPHKIFVNIYWPKHMNKKRKFESLNEDVIDVQRPCHIRGEMYTKMYESLLMGHSFTVKNEQRQGRISFGTIWTFITLALVYSTLRVARPEKSATRCFCQHDANHKIIGAQHTLMIRERVGVQGMQERRKDVPLQYTYTNFAEITSTDHLDRLVNAYLEK